MALREQQYPDPIFLHTFLCAYFVLTGLFCTVRAWFGCGCGTCPNWWAHCSGVELQTMLDATQCICCRSLVLVCTLRSIAGCWALYEFVAFRWSGIESYGGQCPLQIRCVWISVGLKVRFRRTVRKFDLSWVEVSNPPLAIGVDLQGLMLCRSVARPESQPWVISTSVRSLRLVWFHVDTSRLSKRKWNCD
jgi:hypothetical protein